MYRILYTKQAAKDIKNLKSCGLDKKARELIEQYIGAHFPSSTK